LISDAATNAKAALGYCEEGGCWLSRPNYFTLLRKNADKAFAFVTGGNDVLGTWLCNGSARGDSTSTPAREFDQAMSRNDKLLEAAYGHYLAMEGPETNRDIQSKSYVCSKTGARGQGKGWMQLYDPAKVNARSSTRLLCIALLHSSTPPLLHSSTPRHAPPLLHSSTSPLTNTFLHSHDSSHSPAAQVVTEEDEESFPEVVAAPAP
jgi:hypothetical protein